MAGIISVASGGGAPDPRQDGAHRVSQGSARSPRPSPLSGPSQPHPGAKIRTTASGSAAVLQPKALKILIVGGIGVGKTSLARRIAAGSFETRYRTTLGVNLIRAELQGSAAPVRLVLWDTDGDFGHSIFASPYLAGVAGVMGVADATRPKTVAQMASLLDAFDRADPQRPSCAVLTKCDLEQGLPMFEALGARPVFHVSAATGEGVLRAFESLAQAIARGA